MANLTPFEINRLRAQLAGTVNEGLVQTPAEEFVIPEPEPAGDLQQAMQQSMLGLGGRVNPREEAVGRERVMRTLLSDPFTGEYLGGGPVGSRVPPPPEAPGIAEGQPSLTFPGLTVGPTLPQSGMPEYDPTAPQRTIAPPPVDATTTKTAEPSSPPVRAIRLPNGKLLFTNAPQGEYSGTEYTAGEGGRMVREADARNPGNPPITGLPVAGPSASGSRYFPPMDPETDAMRALVRSAARASMGLPKPGADTAPVGRPVTGKFSDTAESGGTFSVMGQPESRLPSTLDDAVQAATLASALQARDIAMLPPQQAAEISNPDVVANQWILRQVGPELDRLEKETTAYLAEARKIPDEAARKIAIANIQDDYKRRQEAAFAKANLFGRQRIVAGPGY